MCETYIRKADIRRRERQAARRPGGLAAWVAGDMSGESEEELDAPGQLSEASEAEGGVEAEGANAPEPALDFARAGRNSTLNPKP